MRSQQKIQNLLHILIGGIRGRESVHQVRHRHGEAEPKIVSEVKLRGNQVENFLIFFWVCVFVSVSFSWFWDESHHFLTARATALTAFCKGGIWCSNLCPATFRLQYGVSLFVVFAMSCWHHFRAFDTGSWDPLLQVDWMVGEGWDWHAVLLKMELAFKDYRLLLFIC